MVKSLISDYTLKSSSIKVYIISYKKEIFFSEH